MHFPNEQAKALFGLILEWKEVGESIEDHLCSMIDSEGENSATLELVKELKTVGLINYIWADNRLYWVELTDTGKEYHLRASDD